MEGSAHFLTNASFTPMNKLAIDLRECNFLSTHLINSKKGLAYLDSRSWMLFYRNIKQPLVELKEGSFPPNAVSCYRQGLTCTVSDVALVALKSRVLHRCFDKCFYLPVNSLYS